VGLIFFILFGFIVGLIARAIYPGRQAMGFIMTSLLGIAGSFVGGAVGSLIAREPVMQLHTAGVIGSIVGAVLILAIGAALGRRGIA
jgi:uncharacterized membrane protein YeaQ/YmgE (transglycosylase-associated protein family)